jgi:integration host factor subunit beta
MSAKLTQVRARQVLESRPAPRLCRSQAVTKADLIAAIADKLKFPWARADSVVEQIFSSMADSLMRGEKIEIRGFGTFTVRQYLAYDGRNPRTGAIVPVRPKRLAFFKVGKELRERVNNVAAADGKSSRYIVGTSAILPSPNRVPRCLTESVTAV